MNPGELTRRWGWMIAALSSDTYSQDIHQYSIDHAATRGVTAPLVLSSLLGQGEESPNAALERARESLGQVAEQAKKEGYPLPSNEQQERADVLLERMASFAPMNYSVYPTADAEIAIDVTRRDAALVVLCDADGTLEGVFDTEDEHTQIWASKPDGTFGAFLTKALSSLRPANLLHERSWVGQLTTEDQGFVRFTRVERLEIGS